MIPLFLDLEIRKTTKITLRFLNHINATVNLIWKYPGVGGYITKLDSQCTKYLQILLPYFNNDLESIKFRGHQNEDQKSVQLNGNDFFEIDGIEQKIIDIHVDGAGNGYLFILTIKSNQSLIILKYFFEFIFLKCKF